MINMDKIRFSTKIGLGTSLIVLLAAVLLTFTFSVLGTRILVDESKKHGRVQAENLALRAVDPILSADFLQLKDLVDAVRNVGSNVVYSFVQDEAGNVLAHTFSNGFPVDLLKANILPPDQKLSIRLLNNGQILIYDFAVPVRIGQSRIGTVRLGLSRTDIQQTINELLHPVLGVSLATLIVAVFLGSLFASRITRRINDLRAHAEALVTGDLMAQAAPKPTANCWEILNCKLEECAAYGDDTRPCWHTAGTRSKMRNGTTSCSRCPVYLTNSGDEIQDLAETFDYLALTLRLHLEELYEAEKAMARQQELLRTVLDSTPDHVCLLDRQGTILALNRAYAEFLGLSPTEAVGKPEETLLPEGDPLNDRSMLEVMFRSGRIVNREVQVVRNNRRLWLHVIRVPVRGASGNITSVLRTTRDITELKSYQVQLIQSQKMESLGTMAGGVAHEINTPLGIILGYAQLLLEDLPDGNPMRDDLRIIEKQTQVCKRIVAGLLDFSRQGESEMQGMCFNNSIMEVITLIRHPFELERVYIVTDLDDRMPVINGNPEQLKQVWVNLFTNARDAMPGGGVIHVRSRLMRDDGIVQLCIADTGTGISPGDITQIFDPFFSTKGVDEGTGLGLSISFGIIESHGGSIVVDSPVPLEDYPQKPADQDDIDYGPGTLFTVRLPLDCSGDDLESL